MVSFEGDPTPYTTFLQYKFTDKSGTPCGKGVTAEKISLLIITYNSADSNATTGKKTDKIFH